MSEVNVSTARSSDVQFDHHLEVEHLSDEDKQEMERLVEFVSGLSRMDVFSTSLQLHLANSPVPRLIVDGVSTDSATTFSVSALRELLRILWKELTTDSEIFQRMDMPEVAAVFERDAKQIEKSQVLGKSVV